MGLKVRTFLSHKGDRLDEANNFLFNEIGLDGWLIVAVEATPINLEVTKLTILYNSQPENPLEGVSPPEGVTISSEADVKHSEVLFTSPIDPNSLSITGAVLVNGLLLAPSHMRVDGNNYLLHLNISGYTASGYNKFQIDSTKIAFEDGQSLPYSPTYGFIINDKAAPFPGTTDIPQQHRRGRVVVSKLSLDKTISSHRAISQYLSGIGLTEDRLITYTDCSRGNDLLEVYFVYYKTLEPQVVSGFPFPNCVVPDVAAPTEVTIVFREPLDRSQVQAFTGIFSIQNSFNSTIQYSPADVKISTDGRVVRLTSPVDFSSKSVYNITVETGLRSYKGDILSKPIIWPIVVDDFSITTTSNGSTGASPGDSFVVWKAGDVDLTNSLVLTGTQGVTTVTGGGYIRVSGLPATTTTLGVASFTGSDFSVTNGIVSLREDESFLVATSESRLTGSRVLAGVNGITFYTGSGTYIGSGIPAGTGSAGVASFYSGDFNVSPIGAVTINDAGISHTGLSDLTAGDPHPIYLSTGRADNWLGTRSLSGLGDVDYPAAGPITDNILVWGLGGFSTFSPTGIGYFNLAPNSASYITYQSESNLSSEKILSGTNGIILVTGTTFATLSGIPATTGTMGVASFPSTNFTVTNGAVAIITSSISHTGLSDLAVGDPHPIYLTTGRADSWLGQRSISGLSDVDYPSGAPHFNDILVWGADGDITWAPTGIGFFNLAPNSAGYVTYQFESSLTSEKVLSGTNGVLMTTGVNHATISGINATATAVGVASFYSGDFNVTGGQVTLRKGGLLFDQLGDVNVSGRSGTFISYNTGERAYVEYGLLTSPELALTWNSTGEYLTLSIVSIPYADFPSVDPFNLIGNPTNTKTQPVEFGIDTTLTMNGTLSRAAITGDVSVIVSGNTSTIGANKVTLGMMAQGLGASLIGYNQAGSTTNATLNTLDSTLILDTVNLRRAGIIGDVTIPTGSNTSSIGANKVLHSMIQTGAGNSVLGVAGTGGGNYAGIIGGTNLQVFQQINGVLQFGNITPTGCISQGAIPYNLLVSGAGNIVLGVAGTGGASIASITAGTNLKVFQQIGGTLQFGNITPTGCITTGQIPYLLFGDSAGVSIIGKSTTGLGQNADIQAASNFQVFRRDSNTLGFGNITPTGCIVTGQIPYALIQDLGKGTILGRSTTASNGPVGEIGASVDGSVCRLAGTTIGFGNIVPTGCIGTGTITYALNVDGASNSVYGRPSSTAGVHSDIQGSTNGQILQNRTGLLQFNDLNSTGIDMGGLTGARGRYFIYTTAGDSSSLGNTSLPGYPDGKYMDFGMACFPNACKLVGISVGIIHNHTGNPGNWRAVVINDTTSSTALMTGIPMTVTGGGQNQKAGIPDSQITFAAGDRLRFYLDGPSCDGYMAFHGMLGLVTT